MTRIILSVCAFYLRLSETVGSNQVLSANPLIMPTKAFIFFRLTNPICCMQDEKDLKIRELSTELHREKKKSAAYQEQLCMVLKIIEEHTQRLSLKVQVVTNNMRELESEEQESSYSD